MSVLNTFWILFKSNADEVIKGNKAIERSTKDTARSIETTTDKTKDLGQSFVKMVEGAASAAGAIAGFKILETGVNNAAAYNAQLKIMADLTGQNAQTLKAMGQAAASAGGTAAGALADIQNLTNQANSAGLPLGPADKAFQAIRDRLKNQSPNERQRSLNLYGINDPGDRWLLSKASDEEFIRRNGAAQKLTATEQGAFDKAFNKIESDANLGGAKDNFYTTIWNKLGNLGNWITGKQTDITSAIAGNGAASLGAGAAVIGGSSLGALGIVKLLRGLATGVRAAPAAGVDLGFSLNGAAGAAAGGAGLLGALGAGGAGLAAGMAPWYIFSKQIEGLFTKWQTRDIKMPSLTPSFKAGGSDLDFWMRQGYTREQAAGIMANMHHESGGRAGAVGDGGSARGLFQWHPDRRDSIYKATGIDISTASYQDQLKAAAWEMKNGRRQFNDDYFRKIKGADEAAAYFSQKFEAPANGVMQSILRGKTALAMASQFPSFGGGGGASVKIDKITINTQATDAAGIAGSLKDELDSQLSFLQANHDDGVDR